MGTLLLCWAVASTSDWQSYTNTQFFNDLCGSDSALVAATNGGVLQIDKVGMRLLKTYVHTDGLTSNRCLVVRSDYEQNLWVGTYGGGLVVVPESGGRAIRYRPNDLPGDAIVTAMAWDSTRLLVGTGGGGIYLIDTKGTQLDFDDDQIGHVWNARRQELLSDYIYSLLVAGDAYWIGTLEGVSRTDASLAEWRGYRDPYGDSVKAMALMRDSVLIVTERGIGLFRPDRDSFVGRYPFDSLRKVYDVDVAGLDIFVATDIGLYRAVASSPGSMELVRLGDVRAVHVGGEKLWIGLGGDENWGHGLHYSETGQTWAGFGLNCLASATVSSCAFNPVTHNVHVCHHFTYWGFRTVTEVAVTDRTVHQRNDALYNTVQVECDSKGRSWYVHFTSEGGLSVYDPEADTWGTVQWGESSTRNIIDGFGIDQHDTKWLFHAGPGIMAVDSSGQQVEFDVHGLVAPPGGGYEFAFDSEHTAWLGLTMGLVRYNYKGTLLNVADDEYEVISAELPSPEVRSVAVGPRDDVWIGTPQGAAVYNGRRWSLFNTNNGLRSNNVYRVRVDGSGRTWFLCDGVLSVYDPLGGWNHYYPGPEGLVPNTRGVAGFYTSLALDDETGYAAVGTREGLTVFRYGYDTPGNEGERIGIRPNPCVLRGADDEVAIDSLPDGARRVAIRSLSGQLVADLDVAEGSHSVRWKPGEVAGGLYLVVVYSPRGTRVERVAVVRP